MLPDVGDHRGRQRHLPEIVDPEQAGAQSIVDVMGIIGDVVGNRSDLRFQRGIAPQLQIIGLTEFRDAAGMPCSR